MYHLILSRFCPFSGHHFLLSLPRCDVGFEQATPTASLSCQSDGTWSKHSIRCRSSPCRLSNNLSVPHLVISGNEVTPVGGTVSLSCPPGFHLKGPAVAECQVLFFQSL